MSGVSVVPTMDTKLVVALGVAVFSFTNYLTRFLVPDTACKSPQQRWKWKNVATSLFHSFITGIWSPIAFYQAPDMCNDLIRTFTPSTHALVSFSIGYFIYDAVDMLVYHRKRSTYELLIHHFLVILCFSIGVVSQQYIAYAALSLMVEVNSVFLHTRQLFIITGEPKSSLRYKSNALLNVGTFLFFRILLLGWMTRWLTVNRDQIPLTFFTVGSVGLAIIVLMNIILFCRILSVDFSAVIRFGQRTERSGGREKEAPRPRGAVNGCHKNKDYDDYLNTLFEEEEDTKQRTE